MFFSYNGIIVQNLDEPTNYFSIPNVVYRGVNAFYHYPLCAFSDIESQSLTTEVFSKRLENDFYQPLEFISNKDLLHRYIGACKKRNIAIRLLCVASQYQFEQWEGNLPDMTFIGYEFCEIPFDSQIITDFSRHHPFQSFYQYLNQYGLYDTIENVLNFKRSYEEELKKGIIGDGEMDTFICKIYEVSPDFFN